MTFYEDHGLPLVRLREQRRELVVALVGRQEISNFQIAEIASLQQAIVAMEAVVGDLDAQIKFSPPQRQSASVFGVARGRTIGNMGFVFGRRSVAPAAHLRLTD
jgi:hypothetical protein